MTPVLAAPGTSSQYTFMFTIQPLADGPSSWYMHWARILHQTICTGPEYFIKVYALGQNTSSNTYIQRQKASPYAYRLQLAFVVAAAAAENLQEHSMVGWLLMLLNPKP
jgi:hypothetical protein